MEHDKETNKVIVQIKGGIGNQLFCYAAARRLSVVNRADLRIDDVSGFARDVRYNRQYQLDHFNIRVDKATPAERLEPFGIYRRKVTKWISSKKPFARRSYLAQELRDFDERLLNLKIGQNVYLDGYWQSESYFKDIEAIIRQDLQIVPPQDLLNQQIAEQIVNCSAVAVHIRWFERPNIVGGHNLSTDYYQKAIDLIEQKVDNPHYFIFSDNPQEAIKKINFAQDRVTIVDCNRGDENAYADLWLMSQCQYFITANSTFSWWGAWLSIYQHKIVIAPNITLEGLMAWGFSGLLPSEWILL